jgi:segregation and condensation protein A
MLLPADEEEEAGEEEDPRMAIVRPLLEHMKIRDAAEALARRTILDRDVFARDAAWEDHVLAPAPREEMVEASLFDLVEAFHRIAGRLQYVSGLQIHVETKTIHQRINEIMADLAESGRAEFEWLCRGDRYKAELILSFLAILELARVGALKMYQRQGDRALTLFYIKDPPPLSEKDLAAKWSADPGATAE